MDSFWSMLAIVGVLAIIALCIFVFFWMGEILGAESLFEIVVLALILGYLPWLIALIVIFPERSRKIWEEVFNKQPNEK